MILVTGGTGFIGEVLLAALEHSDQKVLCTCRTGMQKEKLEERGFTAVVLDFAEAPCRALLEYPVTQVVHFAGTTHAKDRTELYRVNAEGTANLLKGIDPNTCQQFIHVSTAIVTSSRAGPYSESKLASERMVAESGLPHIVLRPALVYGPGDTRNLAAMLGSLQRTGVVPLPGGGRSLLQPVRDLDVADAVLAALDKVIADGSVFYLAGPHPISLKDLVQESASAVGRTCHTVSVPLWLFRSMYRFSRAVGLGRGLSREQIDRASEDKVYDISSARERLGFNPVGFREGISFAGDNP